MVHTAQRQIKKLNPWELRAAMADPAYRRELIEYYYQLHAQTTTPGSVVEYLQQGHPVCGVILMVGAREHHIKDIDGKVHLVPLERIADVSSLFIGTTYAGHDTVLLLRTIHEEREALKATIDLDTLWEVTESERRPWSLDELAALYYHDDAGAHGKAALFRALVENGLFRREGKAFVPVARERANIYRERQHQRGKDDAWLHDAAHWLRALVDGQPATPPADAERILQLLAAHVLHGERRQHESEATALIHLAHFHTLHAIFDALVAAGYWQRDENQQKQCKQAMHRGPFTVRKRNGGGREERPPPFWQSGDQAFLPAVHVPVFTLNAPHFKGARQSPIRSLVSST